MSRSSRLFLLLVLLCASIPVLPGGASAQAVPDSSAVLKAGTLEVQLQGEAAWVPAQLTVVGSCHAVTVPTPNASGPSSGRITHLFDRVERARIHLDTGESWTMVPDPLLATWRQCQGELPH